MSDSTPRFTPGQMQANDPASLERLFGGSGDLIPLWIAEPYLPLMPELEEAFSSRAAAGWYGYEVRGGSAESAFRSWMSERHRWDIGDRRVVVSPSVGTSIGVALELFTEPGDGVILQPPVFTDFKPLVTRAGRRVARNSLSLEDGRYRMDLDALRTVAADPGTKAMILCNPHNPVGRVWTAEELADVARICGDHDVFVIADEIHADIMLAGNHFAPFATASEGSACRWIALHGPTKTFGLAGVADTLIVADTDGTADEIDAMSSRLHLTRNNVFSLAASTTAYRHGGPWLDNLLATVDDNAGALASNLPEPIRLIRPQGTFLAWIDFSGLGLAVPDLVTWLADKAGLALSPGHWFGREGAGYARMTIAVEPSVIDDVLDRLHRAVG